jgi:CheY-like chemotaxis protein
VLVVDDNPVAQRLLAGLLSKRGFEVVAARNGRAALDTLEEVDCDAVLMDVEMPEMDGFEATRRIRASRHSALPIIAITSLSLDGDRRRCLEAGMDDYVGKPFQPAILIETLLRYLGQPAGSVPRCA